MTEINKDVKTVCSFYASDWHLVTMLLPNIDRKINEGVKITTILENDLDDKMLELLDKLRIKNKDRVLDIGWNKTELNNIGNIIDKNDEIIVNGSIEYIDNVHQKINQYLQMNSNVLKNRSISIIDCYDITKYENNVKQILDKHDKILNTGGEKDKDTYITSIKMA